MNSLIFLMRYYKYYFKQNNILIHMSLNKPIWKLLNINNDF